MPDRIPVRSVRNGGLDHIEVPTAEESAVAALLRERAGYIARNLPDRVAQVDAVLADLGHPVASPEPPKQEASTSDDGQGQGGGRRRQRARGPAAAGGE